MAPKKQIWWNTILLTLTLCLTACTKRDAQKPSDQDKNIAKIEQQVIKTSVGREFVIETKTPICPYQWHLLNYEAMFKCVEFVRTEVITEVIDEQHQEGAGYTNHWIFRAVAPGAQRILMANIYLAGHTFDVIEYLETLVEVAPAP